MFIYISENEKKYQRSNYVRQFNAHLRDKE